jgi:uroporphyrinogen decarboxylase
MKKTLQNDRFLRALRRQRVDRTPVWMMRQAGRYLPEYRATRAKAGDFMSLCRNPELCCEVTLQPLARFDLDAAILFSDILTIPDAMGLGLSFAEGEGPRFARPVREARAIEQLGVPDPETDLAYVMNAVRTIDRALAGRVPLIGFAGSPWTLATYMVEGQASREFALVKKLMYDAPELLDSLLAKLSAAVSLYLEAQLRAGADAVMVFDTWGGALAPADYLRFSLAPMERIVRHLKDLFPETPVILFSKNGGQQLAAQADTGADALGLDWTADLTAARAAVGARVALQGNLDPVCLLADPRRIEIEVARVLDAYGPGPGQVFNLGHGILPQTPPEHALAMIEAVKRLSVPLHSGAVAA